MRSPWIRSAWIALAILLAGCGLQGDPLAPLLGDQVSPEVPAPASERSPELATALASVPFIPLETPEPSPTPITFGRMKGGDALGFRTLLYDTDEGDLEIALIGYGSLMLRFKETVVHVNPWLNVADYTDLPKADQIWITDARPEHLDLKAIRTVSTESTRLIVDPSSATSLQDLLEFTRMNQGDQTSLGQIELEAVPAQGASGPKEPGSGEEGIGYVATFGDRRVYIAGDTVPIREMRQLSGIDVALLPIDGVFSMTVDEAAVAARMIKPGAVVPYQVGEEEPSQVASLLQGTGIVVWPFQQPGRRSVSPPLLSEADSQPALSTAEATGPQPSEPRLEEQGVYGEGFLLPDLQTYPPFDLNIRRDRRNDRTLLRLSNSIWNAGPGPLELEGVSDPATGKTFVTQHVYGNDDSQRGFLVGEFIFHPHHLHWHFEGFALYEIWSLTPDGTLNEVVGSSGKVSYCVRDYRRSNLVATNERARYTVCGREAQGISPGWLDTYQYYLEGQSIDITGLEDGLYVLMSTTDPFNLIHETDDSNNMAVVFIEIAEGKVEVVDRPGASG